MQRKVNIRIHLNQKTIILLLLLFFFFFEQMFKFNCLKSLCVRICFNSKIAKGQMGVTNNERFENFLVIFSFCKVCI